MIAPPASRRRSSQREGVSQAQATIRELRAVRGIRRSLAWLLKYVLLARHDTMRNLFASPRPVAGALPIRSCVEHVATIDELNGTNRRLLGELRLSRVHGCLIDGTNSERRSACGARSDRLDTVGNRLE
ncbi:hypothetical protein GCM10010109_61820 [Actinoplanes campanulatus]|nr:hypothetical protein GCM10010109_61820 [Actinoplanes campanulatus]GID42001.1 hypothetical protein Aca09nite_85070 [Actinoplanes campanulatus]